jgi:cell division protein FtsZ
MIGRLCAEESLPDILTALEGADTVTLLAGLGGGCGAGAILTVVKALWRLDNPPTVNAVVTRPWPFETGEMDLTAEVLADLPDFCQEVTVIDPGRASGSNLKTPLFRAKELGLAKLVQASVAETR